MRNKLPQLEPGIKYSSKPFGKRLKYSNRRFLSNKRIPRSKRKRLIKKSKENSQDLELIDVYAEIVAWIGLWTLIAIIFWIIVAIIVPLFGSWLFEAIFIEVRVRLRRVIPGSHFEIPVIFIISFIITFIIWQKSDSNLKLLVRKRKKYRFF